jgi:serine/threonine-protein kinase
MNPPDPISRLNSALEGRYRIESELGEGGMATVYLADDLKHERKVALKVLKPELAAVVGAERFLAEIKTTANLQHPHILPLFDSGAADSFLFYVMPYVEGETLRDRMERERQLPVDEAVRIATDVAEALHSAHEQGIIHRDIKPANILMSKGRPLVADFGIALAVSAAGGGRLTETGLSMGTPYYMSPEQASADREPSPSSDVYSLGCVLFEMLVGEPPYTGGSAQAVLAKILMGQAPAPTMTRPAIPPNLDAAVRKSLEKLPADRFTGADAFASALADPGFRHGEAAGAGVATDLRPFKRMIGVLAGTTTALALGLGWAMLRPIERPLSRYHIDLPVTQESDGFGTSLAISPDGAEIVYVAMGEQGRQLWHRRRDELQATPIQGTEDATNPAFSPDGQRVVFETIAGTLQVVPLTGAPPLTIAGTPTDWWGVSWGSDDYVYATSSTALGRVPATGGEMEPVTAIDTLADESAHAWPQVLPNGRGVLFTVTHGSDSDMSRYNIAVVDLSTGKHETLVPGVYARYVPSGHLVYVTQDGTLMAAAFDQDELRIGTPVALAHGVAVRAFGSVHLAWSDAGTLIYQAGLGGGGRSEFVWVSRSGSVEPVQRGYTFSLSANYGWRLSPDGTRIAFNSATDGGEDVRIKHLPDGPEERITFSEYDDHRPIWSPDGRSVTYFSGPDFEDVQVWTRRADGTGDAVLVLDDERSLTQGAWSPDGEWLVFRAGATAAMGVGQRDILAFRPGVDSAAVPLIAHPDFIEAAPEISPDGRWLSYTSNETGRGEVFLRPFPNVDSTRIRVSANGGSAPLWAKNGREIFFVDGDRGLVAATFDPTSGTLLGQETLFTIPADVLTVDGNNFYDVTADGDRLLMARIYAGEAGSDEEPQFILIQNFFEELKRLVPN